MEMCVRVFGLAHHTLPLFPARLFCLCAITILVYWLLQILFMYLRIWQKQHQQYTQNLANVTFRQMINGFNQIDVREKIHAERLIERDEPLEFATLTEIKCTARYNKASWAMVTCFLIAIITRHLWCEIRKSAQNTNDKVVGLGLLCPLHFHSFPTFSKVTT